MTDSPMIDEDTRDILDTFIPEAIDLLDNVNMKISSAVDSNWNETVHSIFRAFHSIKGTSGALNLVNTHKLTHKTENLLDVFRENSISPQESVLTLLGDVSELLREMIFEVGNHFNDNPFEVQVDNFVDKLQKHIDFLTGKPLSLENQTSIRTHINELKEKLESLKGEAESSLIEEAVDYLRILQSLTRESLFSNISLRFQDILELLSPAIQDTQLINEHSIDYFQSSIESLEKDIEEIFNLEESKCTKKLGEILVEMGDVSEQSIQDAINTQMKPLGELLVENGIATKNNVDKALHIQKQQNIDFKYLENKRKDIRVTTDKLDRLFDLTGELITAESIIRHNPDLNASEFIELKRSVKNLEKVANELQDIVMSVRMVPLESLFIRMKRLVKDLCNKTGKKVDLHLYGAETEIDRNIIEEIVDPLIHIIRNALDHGIEAASDRISEGKRETGQIELKAKHEGNEIWISVKDDGKGINPDKVLKKAVEKGLVEEDPKDLSIYEIFTFLFDPGFSTTDQVSSLSGRGVGMDVVRRNMDKLNGEIVIKSVVGKGTEIVMKIPLTLAITNATLVKVGIKRYAVPLYSTRRYLKAKKKDIVQTEGRNMIRVKDEVIPIIPLSKYYNVESDLKEISDGILILVENNKRKVCLLADEIVGYQQIVIKSLTEYINEAKGVSGCSILGDGKICLIVDSGYIIKDELG